jgi:UDP:flavonoid glycosyltransferase YjiC (YdhE family)
MLRGMNRVLIATMSAAGHVGPLVPLARELVRRGHVVAWYTGVDYRDKVEATGAVFHPHVHAPDRDTSQLDAEFPERAMLKGLAKFRFDVRNVFIAAVPGQVADMEALLDEPRFACRALALQTEMARYDGRARAADLVEALATAAVPS